MTDLRPLARLLALALALFGAGAAAAQAPRDPAALEQQSAAEAARARDLATEAEAVAAEVARLQAELVAVAADANARETASLETERRLFALTTVEAELAAKIANDRARMGESVAALHRLSSNPPPPLASAGGVLDAARADRVLHVAGAALEARANAAAADLARLREVRVSLRVAEREYAEADQRLEERRADLAALLLRRSDLEGRLRADAAQASARAARLAAEAQSVRELIARLDEERRARVATFAPGGFAAARGALPPPTAGELVGRFGTDFGGGRERGVLWRTGRSAQVTAPHDARIEYAGPFRSYGQLLLLAVGDGYHVVLAGLAGVNVSAGQVVLAGEPIGVMADQRRPAPELYLELRRNGEPVDPGPWLRRP